MMRKFLLLASSFATLAAAYRPARRFGYPGYLHADRGRAVD